MNKSGSNIVKFPKKNLLGINFSIARKDEVLEYIAKIAENNGKKGYVVTPNPEILVLAQKDFRFKSALNNAELSLPDGVGVIWANKILKIGLKDRITGVDLVEMLCAEIAEKPITIGFLGARPGVAEKAAECLQKKISKT